MSPPHLLPLMLTSQQQVGGVSRGRKGRMDTTTHEFIHYHFTKQNNNNSEYEHVVVSHAATHSRNFHKYLNQLVRKVWITEFSESVGPGLAVRAHDETSDLKSAYLDLKDGLWPSFRFVLTFEEWPMATLTLCFLMFLLKSNRTSSEAHAG